MHARSSTDDKSEQKARARTCAYGYVVLRLHRGGPKRGGNARSALGANQLDSTMPKISWSLYRNVSLSLLAPMSPRFTACPP